MTENNYYEILGIDPSASSEDIRKAYVKKIREFPNQTHPDEFQKIREAYEVLKDDKSRADYDRVALDDGQYTLLLTRALDEMHKGNYDYAQELLEDMLEDYPDDPSVRNKLSECYYQQGDYHRAKQLISQLILEDPHYESYHYNLALIYQRLDEHTKAIKQYEKLLDMNPDESNYYLSLSGIYIGQQNYEASARVLERKLSRGKETIIDFPLLSELFFLTYLLNKSIYRKQVIQRIKALPQNELEKDSLINMLIDECSQLSDDNDALLELIPMVRELNGGQDASVNQWLREVEELIHPTSEPSYVEPRRTNTPSQPTQSGQTSASSSSDDDDNKFWGCCCCIAIAVVFFFMNQ